MIQQQSPDPPLSPALYLLPSAMSDAPLDCVLPQYNIHILAGITHFIVENVREARRFIRRALPHADISSMQFSELNRHTDLTQIHAYLDPLRKGIPVGLLSDAGCPAIADPGAIIVEMAQREHLRVVPLVGPSSILLALMASGFNGQGFTFHGYLPIEQAERVSLIRNLENLSARQDMTHIFIETPYRNNRLLATLAETLHDNTRICVAADITNPETESIVTRTAGEWRHLIKDVNYDKRPAVFLMYRGAIMTAETRNGRKNPYRRNTH